MLGPEFYEKVGGLVCKNCKLACPCKCSDMVECVRNKQAFI